MKKLVWILVLALLVVPAFATDVSFKIGLLPQPGYFQPGNFTLTWAGKYSDLVDAWAGFGYGVWSGHTDWGNPGTWFAGGLVLKNLGGLADLRFAWNEDVTDSWMGGTMLVSKPLETYNDDPDKFSGIILTLKTPVKVALAVRSELSSDPRLVNRVAARVDGTFAPVTFYGLGYADVLADNTFTNTTVDLGVKVDIPGLPIPASVRGEVKALPSLAWVVRADVTPVSGVSLQARYYDTGAWRVYATLSNLVPSTTISGAYYKYQANYKYNYYYYVYASSTQKLGKLGDLTLWAGLQQYNPEEKNAPTWAFYAKLVTPLPGGVTNTLRVFQNYSDDSEVSWFSSSSLTVDTTIGISF